MTSPPALWALACLSLALLLPGEARAQAAPSPQRESLPPPPDQDTLPAPSAQAGVKRPQPDYDLRLPPPLTSTEAVAWGPRVLLYPLHLALEGLLRRPLIYTLSLGEKQHSLEWTFALLTWNRGQAGIFPTFYYEFGFNHPSIGFYLFYFDLFAPGQETVLRGGFWTDDWVHVLFENHFYLFNYNQGRLSLSGRYLHREDMPFFGIGPDTDQDDKTYFTIKMLEGQVRFAYYLEGLNRVNLSFAYRDMEFGPGDYPSIETLVFQTEEIPGFEGYNLAAFMGKIELDSRRVSRLVPGSGLRLEVFGSYGVDPKDTDLQLVRLGFHVGGFLDVTGYNNVLILRLYTEVVDNLGPEPVPFTELIQMGGQEHMRGFREGRFRGDSALALTLEYIYPIWTYVDADLFLGVGNVFNGYLEDFALEKLFLSWGLAIRTNYSRVAAFELILGFGTNRLDSEEIAVESFHVAFGFNRGF